MESHTTLATDSIEAEPNGVIDPTELGSALDRLRMLVEERPIAEARAFVQQLSQQWPEDPTVRYWARVLAPPTTRKITGMRHPPLDQEHAWLREHAHEHPGCWLAVLGDRLVAADPSFQEVMRVVRQTPGGAALLYYQMQKLE